MGKLKVLGFCAYGAVCLGAIIIGKIGEKKIMDDILRIKMQEETMKNNAEKLKYLGYANTL